MFVIRFGKCGLDNSEIGINIIELNLIIANVFQAIIVN